MSEVRSLSGIKSLRELESKLSLCSCSCWSSVLRTLCIKKLKRRSASGIPGLVPCLVSKQVFVVSSKKVSVMEELDHHVSEVVRYLLK